MSLSVVVLAAGKGTRMQSSLPKVLHPIAGKPMVQHIIDTVKTLGAEHINVVYGHGAEQLQLALAHNDINWCHQAEQLGTGHAVQQAMPHIQDSDTVLILVGDAPLIKASTLKRLLAAKQSSDLALLTVELEDPTGMGRIIRQNDTITAIVEHKDATPAQLAITEINTGIMIMDGVDLKRWVTNLNNHNAQQEYYLVDVIAMAAEEGKIIQAAHPDTAVEVEGVNNRAQLARLERAYQQEQAQQLMLKGVTLFDPSRFDLRGTLTCGQDTVIDINVIIEGNVTIGSNVTIGANCHLIDCSIGDNSVIEPYSTLQQATVGNNCTVGPYARLRPGAELAEAAKVGNFVEVKKAKLGKGAKANHLTYIGDAEIGANANIGAGTITCNYDGANKSTTIIGENAFIGSNTALVAPVEIGKNATVGAGSTITKNVADDALGLTRAKHISKENWQRPVKSHSSKT